MSVSQIYPGRISTSLTSRRLLDALNLNQNAIAKVQTQLATGQQFLLPSEAPAAATQTLVLQKLDERRAAFQQSVQTNQGFLATADRTLGLFSDALNEARGLAQLAAGDQVTTVEREGMALQVQAIIKSLVQAGNTSYSGRYLFSGTATQVAPFEQTSAGTVRYNGNTQTIAGLADFGVLVDSGINGATGLAAVTTPESRDLNPALSLDNRLSDLYSGAGISLGSLRVTLDDGVSTIRKEVDLRTARTVQDLKTQLEAAFVGESITLTVEVDPTSLNGLRLTPSAGTVQIRDVEGGTTARDLGIDSAAVAVMNGRDLDPAVTLFTSVSALNGNTGIGATLGTGLQIVNGTKTTAVNLDGAATLQDVLNRIREADPDVLADFSADGRGISVSSRLSGANFSIGENGGTNATALGLRTFTAETRLDSLNLGTGVLRGPGELLKLTRRDGTAVEVSLQSALTVQDVLNTINAIDPGVLTASLNSVGNGITLTDSSGTGVLSVEANTLGDHLGLSGSNNGGATGQLVGRDVHPRQPEGAFSLLIGLEAAIRNRDLAALGRLTAGIDQEASRVSVVRGNIGIQEQQLESVANILADRQVQIKDQLKGLIDIDYAQTITEFTTLQQALDAYLKVAAQTQQLSVLQYL